MYSYDTQLVPKLQFGNELGRMKRRFIDGSYDNVVIIRSVWRREGSGGTDTGYARIAHTPCAISGSFENGVADLVDLESYPSYFILSLECPARSWRLLHKYCIEHSFVNTSLCEP